VKLVEIIPSVYAEADLASGVTEISYFSATGTLAEFATVVSPPAVSICAVLNEFSSNDAVTLLQNVGNTVSAVEFVVSTCFSGSSCGRISAIPRPETAIKKPRAISVVKRKTIIAIYSLYLIFKTSINGCVYEL
jgi:hypothetical protein